MTCHVIQVTSIPLLRNALGLRRRSLFVTATFVLAYFAIISKSFGVTPAPDGGYPNDNTAEGTNALLSLTSGATNTAVGSSALSGTTTGSGNTAVGYQTLASNISGQANTGLGFEALFNNTAGGNTGMGAYALVNNTTGTSNTATGASTLANNKTGNGNTANGDSALFSNTASLNTATGSIALYFNTSGSDNTASGYAALHRNQTGNDNTATGADALYSNTTGSFNTANGDAALVNNTSASNNTAVGFAALQRSTAGHDNTAEGFQAANNTTGNNNVALGSNAGGNLTTGSNNIDIGANVLGNAGEANTIRVGKSGTQQKAFLAGIYGKTVASGVGVIINSSGQLGTAQSSARFKDDIKPMDKASEAILQLKPVTFRYKAELDSDGVPQFGLIAEQVEKVNPDLVVRDEDGKVNTVRYEAVNAMLLNEFLKEHRKNEEQQKEIGALAAQLKEQAVLIRKISDRLAVSKGAPQLVADK